LLRLTSGFKIVFRQSPSEEGDDAAYEPKAAKADEAKAKPARCSDDHVGSRIIFRRMDNA
jgi:hypothetical protein